MEWSRFRRIIGLIEKETIEKEEYEILVGITSKKEPAKI